MDAQLKRGMTEACVLALLTRGDSYGYRLAQQAGKLMPLSESTLYPVLKRLVESGAVETYSREFSGRLRHYYRVTGAGRAQLSGFAREWEHLGRIYELIREAEQAAEGKGREEAP
jgi:PadR family transcriptional regulator PadR